MRLSKTLLTFAFSSLNNKVYYPVLLSPNYDNIEYAAYYVIFLFIIISINVHQQ